MHARWGKGALLPKAPSVLNGDLDTAVAGQQDTPLKFESHGRVSPRAKHSYCAVSVLTLLRVGADIIEGKFRFSYFRVGNSHSNDRPGILYL